ncbi:hypothetical protein XA68_11037 [Ophiocordyceps unilateralis]|uniref:Ilp is an apoptosis inhibitor n=1 Tax=Ophiocordyceps unilateralis TaxID=268505 RepID=A0A2A9P299_OPHUN|nr:hypothetical protein XA68_11037 [Ophiocordyceps unilateralis]
MSRSFRHPLQESQFDLFEWYPKYSTCLHFFVAEAQHSDSVKAVSAFVNIQLPFQQEASGGGGHVALVPYVRRLVATGFDSPTVLQAFFGDSWPRGIGPIHEAERRNYLFAAKSDTWLRVKANYDMEDGQSVPFLRPLLDVGEEEIVNAESNWSEWLAMQDWMLGPRAPPGVSDSRAPRPQRD